MAALVSLTFTLTAGLELLVVVTAAERAAGGSALGAALATLALAALPLVTAIVATLWLRRSALNYRQLLTETCFWVSSCDVLVALLVLRG
ncbi:hypothetical protein Kisp01_15620 [Kineosporia sp. NBRC 101677]|nr:hypothetical protein Kisp01_15620 [Kineosporia sp. NBRC 101677]